METILSQLKSTEDAVRFGKSATGDELVMLQSLRENCGRRVDRLMKLSLENPDDYKILDQAIIIATKAQLCREAIEASYIKPRGGLI